MIFIDTFDLETDSDLRQIGSEILLCRGVFRILILRVLSVYRIFPLRVLTAGAISLFLNITGASTRSTHAKYATDKSLLSSYIYILCLQLRKSRKFPHRLE